MAFMASCPQISPKDVTNAYHCGSLTYTKAGLVALFGWLLWGDFCFTLMESVVPSILPLRLKSLGAPNWLMGAILATMPGILSMTVCPWVSFRSDRHRSRWGRRIPFIIWTMPFLCAFLALLGWSEEIGAFLQQHAVLVRGYAPATVTIALIAVFMTLFKFFDMFVNSVFWYLFNDVVPTQVLGRFMGTLRIVGSGAGVLYNHYVFKFANTHMREIFTGAALLYFVGFGMMCLLVKEGKYPPVVEEANRKTGAGLAAIKAFFAESFSHKFYWLKFFASSSFSVAVTINTFLVFFYQEMGLSLGQIGDLAAIGLLATMLVTFFVAVFIDRWHPLRISVYAAVFAVINSSLIWIFVTLPGPYFFWITIAESLVTVMVFSLAGIAALPSEMRIFPQSRFGQFCSAQSMLRSVCTVIAGVLSGIFIDFCKWVFPGDFAYRLIHLWGMAFTGAWAYFMVRVYLEWHRLGGDKHFHPPAPWSPRGIEEMPVTPTIGPQSRWLNLALWCFDGNLWLPVLAVPVMMGWMYRHHELFAFRWYGMLVLPLSVLVLLFWLWVRGVIRKDMAAAAQGAPLRYGIPHHGMLLLLGIQYLLMVGIWIAEVVLTVSLRLESGALAFGLAKIVANAMLVSGIWLICRIERGYSTTIDSYLVDKQDEDAEDAIIARNAN